jgi:uncharacterized protein involved in exopolysaccharide biosynthesis
MNIIEALSIIFKHKTKISAIFFVITAIVTAITFLQKPIFEATSSILVKMQMNEDTSRPGIEADNNANRPNISQDEVVNTEVQILTDRELLEKVVRGIGLARMYPSIETASDNPGERMELAVLSFKKKLKVEGVRKSNVIKLSFQHNDPEVAARALNLLVEAFRDKHLALHSDPQSSFINTQLAEFDSKLKTSEKNLQEYQERYKVFSLDDQRSLLLKQKTDFDTAYKVAASNISELRKRIGSLRAQLHSISTDNRRYTQTERDRIITDAKSRLLELQLKEQELRRKYTDRNKFVVDARRDVDMVSNFLKEQEESIGGRVKTGNPVYQSVEIDLMRAEAELSSQVARADALKGQLRQIERSVSDLDSSESRIQNLKREVAINEKNYKTYADRHENAAISDAMNRQKLSNIGVIEAAEIPVKPIKPKKKMNVLLGLLFGMISGVAYAFLLENMAQTFSNPESVEKYLGLPVLLTVEYKEEK